MSNSLALWINQRWPRWGNSRQASRWIGCDTVGDRIWALFTRRDPCQPFLVGFRHLHIDVVHHHHHNQDPDCYLQQHHRIPCLRLRQINKFLPHIVSLTIFWIAKQIMLLSAYTMIISRRKLLFILLWMMAFKNQYIIRNGILFSRFSFFFIGNDVTFSWYLSFSIYKIQYT